MSTFKEVAMLLALSGIVVLEIFGIIWLLFLAAKSIMRSITETARARKCDYEEYRIKRADFSSRSPRVGAVVKLSSERLKAVTVESEFGWTRVVFLNSPQTRYYTVWFQEGHAHWEKVSRIQPGQWAHMERSWDKVPK